MTIPAGSTRRSEPRPGRPALAAEPTTDDDRIDWAAAAAAFRAGDDAAASVVAGELLPYVARLVRRLAAWSSDADDLVQDVLVAALAARSRFRGDASLKTWVTRIAINACRAYGRKLWVRRRLFGAWAARLPPADAAPADRPAIASERNDQVRRAVARLPQKYREPIALCYFEEMTPAEAAAALHLRVGTLEVRLTRARAQLREALKDLA